MSASESREIAAPRLLDLFCCAGGCREMAHLARLAVSA